MYKVILFDLDGTLTDSALGITNSVIYALDKRNISVVDRATLYKFIGPPLNDSFSKFYGFSKDECKIAIEDYREYFSSKGIYENELYNGVKELLENLKENGKTIVLATSKPEEFAITILKYFNIDKYFDYVIGAALDGSISKKADIISLALERCGIAELSDAVMVGDREYDISGAGQAGIDSIGVLYGYGGFQELKDAGATYIVKDVEDISKLII